MQKAVFLQHLMCYTQHFAFQIARYPKPYTDCKAFRTICTPPDLHASHVFSTVSLIDCVGKSWLI